MEENNPNFEVQRLGECRIPSPMDAAKFFNDRDHVLYHSTLPEIEAFLDRGEKPPLFEIAGPRD